MSRLIDSVENWQSDLAEEVAENLSDMAELENEKVEAEATAFAAKLFLEVTGKDWKDAGAMAQLLESYFQTKQGEIQG